MVGRTVHIFARSLLSFSSRSCAPPPHLFWRVANWAFRGRLWVVSVPLFAHLFSPFHRWAESSSSVVERLAAFSLSLSRSVQVADVISFFARSLIPCFTSWPRRAGVRVCNAASILVDSRRGSSGGCPSYLRLLTCFPFHLLVVSPPACSSGEKSSSATAVCFECGWSFIRSFAHFPSPPLWPWIVEHRRASSTDKQPFSRAVSFGWFAIRFFARSLIYLFQFRLWSDALLAACGCCRTCRLWANARLAFAVVVVHPFARSLRFLSYFLEWDYRTGVRAFVSGDER